MISADKVIVNGKVATVDKAFSFAEAIAVKDGWIIDVGRMLRLKSTPAPKQLD
jgi:predicted amidohydrolase YtcJ